MQRSPSLVPADPAAPAPRPACPGSRPAARSQQNLSNLCWAYAKLGHVDDPLLTAIAGAARVGQRRQRGTGLPCRGCA